MLTEAEKIALLALAERCEAATGPDRHIDSDIAATLGLNPGWAGPRGSGLNHATWSTGRDYWDAPRFTASIDAGKKLLAPGTLWAVGSMEDGPFARLCWPQPNGGFVGGYFEARASTAELALCAAASRARAA